MSADRQARPALQRDALVRLAGLFHVRDDDARIYGAVTETVATTLAVSRVSVWRYTPGHDGIACLDLFDQRTGAHSRPAPLARSTCPAYFDALRSEDVIVAPDARRDSRTREFTDSYLAPLGITSMLDAPFKVAGGVEGVVCCEHRGPLRAWDEDEVTFVVAVGQVLSRLVEQAERSHVESAVRLRSAALNAAIDAVSIVDAEGRVLWGNDMFAARVLEGLAVAPSATVEDFGLLSRDALDTVFERGAVWHAEVQRTVQGQAYIGHQTLSPIRDTRGHVAHAVVIERDLTVQRSLEAQLQQSQKMEAVGQLTGGIAHDFNNLLTIIGGHAQLLADGTITGDGARDGLMEIVHATSRAAALTRQLLAFSRRQQLTPEIVDLNAVLADLANLLRRALGASIRLALHLDGDGVIARVDRVQFEQVVMNMVVNARDAMPAGGTLRIRTAVIGPAQHHAVRQRWAAAPMVDLLRITLQDTGCGMTDDVRARVFEPFFSTRPRDKGTGLGLSTVYGIVAQSGGHIHVESEVGRGSTFTVYLPRHAAPLTAPRPAPQPQHAGGHETILVVEDEPAVRTLTVGLLRSAGYDVLEAGTPHDAKLIVAGATCEIDLLLTDVVLPEETGPALYDTLAGVRPQLRVLFMSGYPRERGLREFRLGPTQGFLPKPFSREALLAAVRASLSGPGAPEADV